MREIETGCGKFKVRGLNRGQIEALQQKGHPITRWGMNLKLENIGQDPDLEKKMGQMFDDILEAAVTSAGGQGLTISDLTPADERRLFNAVVAETYGAEDEEKNLPGSGDGTQTGSE